jgi:hypothetical protein
MEQLSLRLHVAPAAGSGPGNQALRLAVRPPFQVLQIRAPTISTTTTPTTALMKAVPGSILPRGPDCPVPLAGPAGGTSFFFGPPLVSTSPDGETRTGRSLSKPSRGRGPESLWALGSSGSSACSAPPRFLGPSAGGFPGSGWANTGLPATQLAKSDESESHVYSRQEKAICAAERQVQQPAHAGEGVEPRQGVIPAAGLLEQMVRPGYCRPPFTCLPSGGPLAAPAGLP